jgi:hypothetical protein
MKRLQKSVNKTAVTSESIAMGLRDRLRCNRRAARAIDIMNQPLSLTPSLSHIRQPIGPARLLRAITLLCGRNGSGTWVRAAHGTRRANQRSSRCINHRRFVPDQWWTRRSAHRLFEADQRGLSTAKQTIVIAIWQCSDGAGRQSFAAHG